jgi:lysozyme
VFLTQPVSVSAESPPVVNRAVVCADGETLPGIDVDRFNGEIDWPSVVADGIEFAYIRVANGLSEDDRFAGNWTEADDAGIVRGAIQILQPADDAAAQAQVLIDAVGSLAPGDLPPALAVEINDGQNPATITAKVGTWLTMVEASLGLPGVIYTGRYFWEDNVGSSDYSDHPLWIAHYTTATCPTLPAQWDDWAFWQDSSSGEVEGITGFVATNIFNGDLAALRALGKPCEEEACRVILTDGFEDSVQGK